MSVPTVQWGWFGAEHRAAAMVPGQLQRTDGRKEEAEKVDGRLT